MIRAWIAIILLALGIAAVRAMPASQQIIMFGKGSSASGGGGGSCSPGAPTGQMDFSVCSNIGITAALP